MGASVFGQRLWLWLVGLWQRMRVIRARDRLRERELDLALEEVVAAFDPRVRAVGGYRRRLRPVVEQALAYFEQLIGRLPGPFQLDSQGWASEPVLNVLFSSADRLPEVMSRSRDVRLFFREHPHSDGCFAVLSAFPQTRNVLGTALVGEMLRRDVRQTTFSFADFRVDLAAATEGELRSNLKHLAMKALAGLALERVSEQEARIGELEERQRMLRIKRKVLDVHAHGLDALLVGNTETAAEIERLQQRLAEVDQELIRAREGLQTLDDQLARLVEVLGRPDAYLTLESLRVRLDRMNVVLAGSRSDEAEEIEFMRAHRGEREGRVFLVVHFPRSDLLPEGHFLREAERYVG